MDWGFARLGTYLPTKNDKIRARHIMLIDIRLNLVLVFPASFCSGFKDNFRFTVFFHDSILF